MMDADSAEERNRCAVVASYHGQWRDEIAEGSDSLEKTSRESDACYKPLESFEKMTFGHLGPSSDSTVKMDEDMKRTHGLHYQRLYTRRPAHQYQGPSLRELSKPSNIKILRLVQFLGLVALTFWIAARYGLSKEKASSLPRSRPNIIFIMTDDQDKLMDSLSYMQGVRTHLIEQGTTYNHHFCTVSLCCPSRVSLWTGQAAHNTNVTDIFPPYGGYPKFISQGYNSAWLPIWMQNAGYATYYVGKLMNSHSIATHHNPYVAGFNGSEFLLDPGTYKYYNSTFQRNQDPPVNYLGEYSTELVANKSWGFLEDGFKSGQPFFLTIAPIAPHVNIGNPFPNGSTNPTPPEPAEKYKDYFPDAIVPRTPNFNPSVSSGAFWIKNLPQQTQSNVDFNDEYYRQRLRTLQSVDEIVNETMSRLEAYGILNNTYIIFSSDNGYHIGQHRLQPGKQCPYEEDVNIPLIIRGPGVPAGTFSDLVTSHTDLAPTILSMAGQPPRSIFDGVAIPLTSKAISLFAGNHDPKQGQVWEHASIEHWGTAASDGAYGHVFHPRTTYKALRVISKDYSLFYSVWCNNEHELYDLQSDAGQMENLYGASDSNGNVVDVAVAGQLVPVTRLQSRLDSLLLVLKACKTSNCTAPWAALHPLGDVNNLQEALDPRFDKFYEQEQRKVSFDECKPGQLLEFEGPLEAIPYDPDWHLHT